MATNVLAISLQRVYTDSRDGEQILMPTNYTAIRRALDQCLEQHDVRPILIGDFEDYALLREFARSGHGFAPVPAVLQDEFQRQYGLLRIGSARPVKAEFYAISLERKVKHPGIGAVIGNARQIFSRPTVQK